MFLDAGWRMPRGRHATENGSADLVVNHGNRTYVVEIKAASEGRADRLVPLWSQAWLEAVRDAPRGSVPLAVVAAPRVSPRAAEQVLRFAAEYAPEAAAGVVDLAGLRRFRGPGLEELSRDAPHRPAAARPRSDPAANLFSDLNQWMLKVLLAPELPETLLAAPRDRYRTAAALARAAGVSVMSASRFIRQLKHEGFLHESSAELELVRRAELFRRWEAWSARRVREVGFRFLLRGGGDKRLARAVHEIGGCLALFAAADALGFGFVHGVPTYVYVRQMSTSADRWPGLVAADGREPPELIVRAAPAPQSVFRGAVVHDGLPVADVIQVWLDVAAHPSRGAEQAEFIRAKVLDPVLRGGDG
jgi:hypothetical protein